MPRSILITQCLQNDFVQRVGPHDRLPNLLHVGYEESLRLLGESPVDGPVARIMRWAHDQPEDELAIVHIRDWHDPQSPAQRDHLRQFQPHCLQDTAGARFVFEDAMRGRRATIINASGLNDFIDTPLADVLDAVGDDDVRVGLMGVWTEAKITFLAYELRTRYPRFQLCVCPALTAGSSRLQHCVAIEQLQRLLGVTVVATLGEFIRYLGGDAEELELPAPTHADRPRLVLAEPFAIGEVDERLLKYLFRDCQEVRLRPLAGGFSGNLVLGCSSIDHVGHRQTPHVVKIGPEAPIGRERTRFEQIEAVLGNHAPRIAEFIDHGGRGALKYRYAAMGTGNSESFQKRYRQGLDRRAVRGVFNALFEEQLGRLYAARMLEKINLLEYYEFRPEWLPGVAENAVRADGPGGEGRMLKFPGGREVESVVEFYRRRLAGLLELPARSAYVSYVHGDLNGANIILDGHDNVWLVDFFHAHRGHVLKDLIKLENDLLYIFTPIDSEAELEQALALTDVLLKVEDLGRPIPDADECRFSNPHLQRALETIQDLRAYYPALIEDDRNPLQLLIGQLRYAVHTMSFEECNVWQKRWALYAASQTATQIASRMQRTAVLRVDWLDERFTGGGRLGLTILPGRADFRRVLQDDLDVLRRERVSHVVCLLSDNEFRDYGVEDLLAEYNRAGFVVHRLPILDQSICRPQEMRDLNGRLVGILAQGGRIVVHCVGGLGRAGMAAACMLRQLGLSADRAIAEVRRARSPRAIETPEQEEFVRQLVLSDVTSLEKAKSN